ncbi:biotin attachment protein [Alicyclobacillus mali]|uniref:Biotin attachment protein n=1 Tax=Alicyclobacillus mali (ex Roth et al. 2021) TaxID=1123961 RepID=A0ABS0F2F3_9BACL|nr:biotin/lipoyl-containing protein [Alicyclobacillus mali (ex Roth et al. 2021)]MBF8377478.1 biotin attachment protein [Alicyclobacillus mali (ex Roth et al. 2021)]MCL6489393.1 biotin attachment protein [Alicyclobacillus mali (ex Roth et al. 2021)]
MVEVRLPQLGDSVTKAVVTSWLKAEGDRVEKDEPLLEVTTDKVTVEVPSEVSGVVKEIVAKEGHRVQMDDVLCRIEEG